MVAAADRLYRALLVAVTVLLGALTVVVSYQVIGRYVPFIPRAIWTEEISRLCLEWLVFLGAALAIRRNEHFIIDVIPSRVATRFRVPIQLVILAFLALASVAIIVGGLALAETGLGRTSTTSGITLTWAFASLPVAGLCMLFFVIELAVRTLRGEAVEEIGADLVDQTAVTPEGHGIEGVGE
ncbi:TRAP transporter small permease [Occultella glacieicola]|nr:TRAP transporter small permease [Occultella glacieicola]